jgi:hypothetical protein
VRISKSLSGSIPVVVLALGLACGGGGGGSTSSAPAITTHPADVTVNQGSAASFTLVASGSPAPTFAWSRSNDNGTTWQPIAGATGASYTFQSAQPADDGARFRATATNSAGSATSNAATLTVGALPAPAITTHPANAAADPGTSVSFTVAVTGSPTPTIGWERSDDSGATWAAVNGASGSPYTFTAALADNGAQFRAVATNSAGTATSNPATLSVPATATKIYVGGYGITSTNSRVAGTWTNGAWTAMTLPAGTTGSEVKALAVAAGKVYAAGTCTDGAGNVQPGYWVDGAWTALPVLTPSTRATAVDIAVSGSDVYVAGSDLDAAGLLQAGYWRNGVRSGPAVAPPNGSTAQAMVLSGGDVYIGGNLLPAPGTTRATPGYFLNGAWTALPESPQAGLTLLACISVSGGQVVGAGSRVSPGLIHAGA